MKRIIQNKTFYKYLLSYIVLLLIPSIIMASLLYSRILKTVEKEININNTNSLYRIKKDLDYEFQQINNITSQLYLNDKLRSFYLKNTPSLGIELIEELGRYATTNLFIEEIAVLYYDDNYVYTSTSSHTFEMFFNERYHYENWSVDEFKKDINSITKSYIRPLEKVTLNSAFTNNYVTIISPLKDFNLNTYGVIMYFIPEKSFTSLISTTQHNLNKVNTVILNHNKEVISQVGDKSFYLTKNNMDLIETMFENNLETIFIDNEEYIISFHSTGDTNWIFLSFVPSKIYFEKYNDIQRFFFYGMIAIFILGSLSIYFLMTVNYQPVKQLINISEKVTKTDNNRSNDLYTVKSTLEFLSERNNELTNRIEGNKAAIKSALVFSTLKGNMETVEKFNTYGREVNLSFSKEYYTVFIVNIKSLMETEKINYENVINSAEEKMRTIFECYGREHFNNNSLVFILGLNNDEYIDLEEELRALKRALKNKYKSIFTFGVGNIYSDITNVPKSFIEASTAIGYSFVKGDNQIIFYKDIIESESHYVDYPLQQLDVLISSIKNGSTDKIEQVVYNILKYLKKANMPIFIAKGICFDIINAINKTLQSVNINYQLMKIYPDVFSLSRIGTMDELAEILIDICSDVCTSINVKKENKTISYTEQLVNYINHNYSDYDFSVQAMAEHFNISAPNLSIYFKDHFGKTLLDYITELKINKAKELLKTSDLSLQNISEEVGYYNVSSFIRRFKQLTGVTPGEYRKEHET